MDGMDEMDRMHITSRSFTRTSFTAHLVTVRPFEVRVLTAMGVRFRLRARLWRTGSVSL
jgi:hypothetical protein